MSGGALFQHADSVPRFFGTAAHGMFAGLDSKLVEISFFGLSLNAVVTMMGCVPVVLVGISTISKEAHLVPYHKGGEPQIRWHQTSWSWDSWLQ
jgi:hypothetical protein